MVYLMSAAEPYVLQQNLVLPVQSCREFFLKERVASSGNEAVGTNEQILFVS